MRAFLALVAAFSLWILPAHAQAHVVNLSQSDFTVEGARVHALVVFAKPDAVRLGHMDPDQNGVVTAAELEASQAVFRALIEQEIPVTADGLRCASTLEGGGDVEEDGFGLSLDFVCAAAPRTLTVSMNVLRRLLPGHEHMLRLRAADVETTAVLTAADPTFELLLYDAERARASTPARSPLWGAIRFGIEHILTSWDHLLFLLALLLGTKGVRSIVVAISAFTVAHSITLALAALGVVALDPRIVEPAIAASIAYVAFENVFRPGRPHRWRLTFAFGLVHGFGFAGALRDLALTRDRLLPTLLGFNAGVEIGQLLVLALVVPVIGVVLRGRTNDSGFVRGASLLIGASGCVAFVARIVAAR